MPDPPTKVTHEHIAIYKAESNSEASAGTQVEATYMSM